MHISQAELTALKTIRQFLMVNAEAMQNRRLQIVNMDAVGRDIETKIIRRAVRVAAFDAAARVMREDQPIESLKRTEFAYELLDRSRDDLRRSFWSLRVGVLEGRSFAEALAELTHRTERTYDVTCTCQLETDGTRVPDFEANHLLLLAQEAINNALKHGSPQKITVTGKIETKKISLAIANDGKGFDPKSSPGPQDGHFGLLRMRERARALGGFVDIQSALDQETKIVVEIPLNSRANGA